MYLLCILAGVIHKLFERSVGQSDKVQSLLRVGVQLKIRLIIDSPLILTIMHTSHSHGARPDKHTDRVAWNKSWEDELNEDYERWQSDCPFIPSPELAQFTLSTLAQRRLTLEQKSKEISRLQDDIQNFVRGEDGLEEKWRELKDGERLDIILTALFTTSCIGPDMEKHRAWCPDITLAKIGGRKGQGFIDLLGVFITSDSSKPRKKPIYFKDAMLDRYMGDTSPGTQALKANIDSDRSYFISFFIWRVLLTLASLSVSS